MKLTAKRTSAKGPASFCLNCSTGGDPTTLHWGGKGRFETVPANSGSKSGCFILIKVDSTQAQVISSIATSLMWTVLFVPG
jgi:hypothetical protein